MMKVSEPVIEVSEPVIEVSASKLPSSEVATASKLSASLGAKRA
jgi:hypothetical protein